MQIPVEILRSNIKGGWFEWCSRSRRGWWHKGGKVIATWTTRNGGKVTWNKP